MSGLRVLIVDDHPIVRAGVRSLFTPTSGVEVVGEAATGEEAVTLANRDGNTTPPAPRRKPIQMPGLQDVAERLSSAFDTRVTVSLGKRKGKIVVEFGSVDDLQRIVEIMSAEDH